MATSYSPTYTAIAYNPAGTTHKRLVDVYYPEGQAPAGGWPALFYFNCTGFTLSGRDGVASVNDGHDLLRYYALEAGWALIDVEVTVQDVGGPPTGGGLYRDPTTDAAYSLEGTGDEVFNSDARNVVQKFRSEAQDYGLNPARFAAAGNSAGSMCAMAAAYEIDGADNTNPLAMRRASTRVQALVDLKISAWLPGVVQDSSVGGALDTGNPILCKASDAAQLAVDGDDALDAHALHISPHWIMLQAGSAPLNRRLAVYCWVNTPPEGQAGKEPIEPPTLSYDLDADLLPAYLGDSLGGIVDRHAGFGGIMRMKALRQIDSWHDTHSKLVGTADFDVGGMTPDEIISDQHEAAAHQAAWLNTAVPQSADPDDGGDGGPGFTTIGAQWITASAEGAVFPLDGHGGAADTPAESHLPERCSVVLEGIYLESVAGEEPSVTITDAGGNDLLTIPFEAVSTGGRAGEFLNVQRGVVDYGATAGAPGDSTTAALSPAVVAANTWAYLNNIRRANAGRTTPDTVALVNDDVGETMIASATLVGFARYAGGEDVDHRLAWEAIEYIGAGAGDPNQIAVRAVAEVTIADTSATTTTGAVSTISAVADTIVIVTSQRNDRNADGPDSVNVTAVLNGDKTITVTRGATSGEWKGVLAVIEFPGSNWQVETWSHTFTSPGGTAQAVTLSNPIPAWGNAFIVGSMRAATGHLDGDESGMIVLPGADLLTIGAAIPAGADDIAAGTYVANGWVVYNADMTVQHNNNAAGFGGTLSAFGGTVQTNDNTITAVDLATSFILTSGISTGSAANLPSPNCNVRLKDATTIETWRGRSASGSTVTYAIQVVSTAAPGLDFDGAPVGRSYRIGRKRGGVQLNGRFGVRVNTTGTQAKVFYRTAAVV